MSASSVLIIIYIITYQFIESYVVKYGVGHRSYLRRCPLNVYHLYTKFNNFMTYISYSHVSISTLTIGAHKAVGASGERSL